MIYKEIKGDLIQLALQGEFDVIAHGCNCFCTQKSGIAKEMVKHFGTNNFKLETLNHSGNISKLGNLDYEYKQVAGNNLIVINAYTQYEYGTDKVNLDYEALTLCMRKINHRFKGLHIGLPQIGCGLAGGNEEKVLNIIKKELKDMNVTMVIYNK